MVERWQRLRSKTLGFYKIFHLREDSSRSPTTGLTHSFYVLEAPDWINVLPVTPAGEILMVRQYRHGTDEVTLEIPAGMVDPDDPDPADAAARELREETGYVAEQIVKIGRVAPNPAFLDNYCHTFLALNVTQQGAQQLDGTEEISYELVPMAAVQEMIDTGDITHSLTILAMYWYERYLANAGSADG